MLAIDVAKDTRECTLVDPATRQDLWRRSVPNSPQGFQSLLDAAPPDARLVLEPTGRYSKVQYPHRQGRPRRLPHGPAGPAPTGP
ncbi:MAG: hypothetical protein JO250_23135 [Armatimonadetes bacterium]|nr:hypothetical protein [Armatimonadota bacterium]